ncbi:hypothetical protein ACFPVV_07105 [Macrococcoides bohemicum]|uniref:Uncharacterized protein n=1 Tax=Macrococcoides bohemicum TaxID=1903056 RepID=A0A327ZZE8_9STAP|nr:hypothetical protein [Macrococcus bohemicus]RAK47650.1 hypothetical protein BHX94_12390 [Macrococcus bohemicus]
MASTQIDKEELEKKFDEICLKKRLDLTQPLKLAIWNRFQILHVGTRTRKDLDIVVSQLSNKNKIVRSSYANHLWDKCSFK